MQASWTTFATRTIKCLQPKPFRVFLLDSSAKKTTQPWFIVNAYATRNLKPVLTILFTSFHDTSTRAVHDLKISTLWVASYVSCKVRTLTALARSKEELNSIRMLQAAFFQASIIYQWFKKATHLGTCTHLKRYGRLVHQSLEKRAAVPALH